MSILVYNVNGARPTKEHPTKPLDIRAYAASTQATILVLTETHFHLNDTTPPGLHARSRARRKGISIIPLTSHVALSEISQWKGRLLVATATFHDRPPLKFAAVYAPADSDRAHQLLQQRSPSASQRMWTSSSATSMLSLEEKIAPLLRGLCPHRPPHFAAYRGTKPGGSLSTWITTHILLTLIWIHGSARHSVRYSIVTLGCSCWYA